MKPTCDWGGHRPPSNGKSKRGTEQFIRHVPGFKWSGVKTEKYKCEDGTWSDVIRRTIIGEGDGKGLKFHLRYFEIAPGGHTTLERHRHEHVVIGINGKGRCTVGRKKFAVNFLDVVYIPPDEAHMLENNTKEPFGFFCIVNAKRDRPKAVKA